MDTRLLKFFVAVAEEGSLVAAARKLHLTPSALSHGLKSLESTLSAQLFDRVGKRLLLNYTGQQLLQEIRQPLAALDQAAAKIQHHALTAHPHLRVGAPASICQHLLPPVWRELRKSHPGLDLEVQTGEIATLRNLLDLNEIDLFIASGLDRRDGLKIHPLFRDELLFVFSAHHAWADGRPLSRERLGGHPLILYHRSSPTARRVLAELDAIGFTPTTVMQVGSIEAIIDLVRLNLGVSVLAPWTASRDLVRGRLKMRPLGRTPLRREWILATLARRHLSPPAVDFLRLCRAHASAMRLDRRDVPS